MKIIPGVGLIWTVGAKIVLKLASTMVRSETFPGRYGQLVADLLGEDQGDHSGLAGLHQFGRSRTGAATPRLEDVTQMAVRITLASCQDDFAHVDTNEGTVDAARRGGR